MNTTIDDFLGGKVRLMQEKNGYRATSDSVLVAAAVQTKPNESVLDVGCGSGIILYCLNARVTNLALTGIEIQDDLHKLIKSNNQLNNCNINIIHADISSKNSSIHGLQFHHVVTNPPYYTEDFKRRHPQTATAYHQTVSLNDWLKFCLKHIRAKGTLTIIHRIEALPEILEILNKSALGAIEVIPIYSKEDMPAKRVIIRGTMGSKKPFTLRTGLIMHTVDDKRTQSAENILRLGMPID